VIALVQRVSSARVEIGGACIAAIDGGLLVFICAQPTDAAQHAERLVAKLLALRIFGDEAGKMNLFSSVGRWQRGANVDLARVSGRHEGAPDG